ncbi:hypothetical protein CEXT_752141 [Caerostris extrusa]|uniref:Transposase n=1 Tax=Caerostris extrusa TaxID=172846 RepID=A0AAV4Y8U9_CAEEX|nr:hypothetical protein CEXT_752141 [Caerostris extrusa]
MYNIISLDAKSRSTNLLRRISSEADRWRGVVGGKAYAPYCVSLISSCDVPELRIKFAYSDLQANMTVRNYVFDDYMVYSNTHVEVVDPVHLTSYLAHEFLQKDRPREYC